METQIGIVENALPVAKALGNDCPKVAVLSAVENVTEKMVSTVTAAEIAKRGVPGCIISGPLALDGAISMESVKHKAIHDPVAGQADILLVPFIEIGNVLYKACTYIAGKTMASTICGASCPVVITSRADTPLIASIIPSSWLSCAALWLLKKKYRETLRLPIFFFHKRGVKTSLPEALAASGRCFRLFDVAEGRGLAKEVPNELSRCGKKNQRVCTPGELQQPPFLFTPPIKQNKNFV